MRVSILLRSLLHIVQLVVCSLSGRGVCGASGVMSRPLCLPVSLYASLPRSFALGCPGVLPGVPGECFAGDTGERLAESCDGSRRRAEGALRGRETLGRAGAAEAEGQRRGSASLSQEGRRGKGGLGKKARAWVRLIVDTLLEAGIVDLAGRLGSCRASEARLPCV